MQVHVQSNSVPVTQALRSFAEEQVERLLRKTQRITHISFAIRKVLGKNDSSAAKVTCRVKLPGQNLVVTRNAGDVYEAIVDVSRRAARKLRKTREKRVQASRKAVSRLKDWDISDLPPSIAW